MTRRGGRGDLDLPLIRTHGSSDKSQAAKTAARTDPHIAHAIGGTYMAENKGYASDGSRARILVVEDEEALARLLKSHLERAGHDVHVEHRGKPALVFAAEHRTDLVVLDLML